MATRYKLPAPNTNRLDSGDKFFGWRILAIATITSVMTGPGQTIGVSVFIDHLVGDLALSRSAVSSAYLVGTLTGAMAMPTIGRFIDSRGTSRSQTLIGLVFAAALVNMALIPTLSGLFGGLLGVSAAAANVVFLALGFAGIRMWGQGALSMVANVSVIHWFDKRRGLAVGLLATVASAGMAIVPFALNAVIEASGWRWAWVVAAAVVLTLVVPMAYFGLVDRPSDVGQVPDGVRSIVPDESNATTSRPQERSILVPEGGLERWEAFRRLEFWVLASMTVSVSMLVTGLNFHQIDLLGEVGLDAQQAAAMFLPQIIGSSLTGIGFGWIMDRIGIRFVPPTVGLLLFVTHLLVANLSGTLSVLIYAIMLGACIGSMRSVVSTASPAYFGTAHIGAIGGLMAVATVAGSALGPVTLSLMQDWLGGYRQANLALAVLPAAVTLFALVNPSRHFAVRA